MCVARLRRDLRWRDAARLDEPADLLGAPQPKPRVDFRRDRMRWDGVLCPAHNRMLEALLKPLAGGDPEGTA